jgi:hypothetical protein
MEVLKRSEFYPLVEEMYLECVRFDHIVHFIHLDKIKKFVNLKKLYLSHNNLNSFILLSKLECLQSLETLIIENNDILNCNLLKDFVVYRFQHLNYFGNNSEKITEQDRQNAKLNFQKFDGILSKSLRRMIPQIHDPTKKQEFKIQQKKHAEFAKDYIDDMLGIVVAVHDNADEIHDICEDAMRDVIRDAVEENIEMA